MTNLDRADITSPSMAAALTAGMSAGSQLKAPVPPGVERELLAIQAEDGVWHDSTLLKRPGPMPSNAIVVMHPAADFKQHYTLGPLAEMGYAAMGVSPRFAAESEVIMEELLLDLASSIKYLKENGCERVTLLGTSGGGPLAAFYQAEAEQATVTCTPAGDPPDLTKADLPAVDALVILASHQGRPQVLAQYIDPAVVDEADPLATDPSLNMFDPANGPPYSEEFVARYQAAQVERSDRITAWAQNRLKEVRSQGVRDEAFVVHRTLAALEFLDLSLDPSDRKLGWYSGTDVYAQNMMAASLGRFNSLCSWLSSYGLKTSNAHIIPCLGRVSVPVLVVQPTGDQGVFARNAKAIYAAAVNSDRDLFWVEGDHFFAGQPENQQNALTSIHRWLVDRNFGSDV